MLRDYELLRCLPGRVLSGRVTACGDLPTAWRANPFSLADTCSGPSHDHERRCLDNTPVDDPLGGLSQLSISAAE